MRIAPKEYKKNFDYTYASGVFATVEVLQIRPQDVIRVFLNRQGQKNKGLDKIQTLCRQHNIPTEWGDGLVMKLSDAELTQACERYLDTLREAKVTLEQAEVPHDRGDLHAHTTWSDGKASVLEMGEAARELGYEYLAICDHTPAVGAVRGLTPDDVRRQADEIAAANTVLAPFRVLRGIECDILPDGRLDLPDDVLAELDWVQASVHGGQRMPRAEMTKRVEEAQLKGAPHYGNDNAWNWSDPSRTRAVNDYYGVAI